MRHPAIGIFNETQNLWLEATPRIYLSGEWHDCQPYIFDTNAWRLVGGAGALMVPFITSDGEYFYTSDNKMFLVREHS